MSINCGLRYSKIPVTGRERKKYPCRFSQFLPVEYPVRTFPDSFKW